MKQTLPFIEVEVLRPNPKAVILKCKLAKWDKTTSVSYKAANSADYRQSYTGSGLPFPDAIVAMDNTDNKGTIKPSSKEFVIKLKYPNSYYSHLGTRLILPHVHLSVKQNNKIQSTNIQLGENAPFRTLTYQTNPVPRISPNFYSRKAVKMPRSQEQILRDSGYSLETPKNFWGKAVPP
mgnify:FL=1|tara:strand:- start:13013 stop:13549 length:537 start_codon:yes stop_codon:yes gene_type:complete